MSETAPKKIQQFDVLGEDIRSLISLRVELEILQFMRRLYIEKHLRVPSYHTPYGWPLEDCLRVYLHWLVKYPNVRFYTTYYGIPHNEIKPIVKFIMALSDGCPHLELSPCSSEERKAMSFDPLLPQDLMEFSDCTLFVDGIDYARTAKGLDEPDEYLKWYSYKVKGPGLRSVVPL